MQKLEQNQEEEKLNKSNPDLFEDQYFYESPKMNSLQSQPKLANAKSAVNIMRNKEQKVGIEGPIIIVGQKNLKKEPLRGSLSRLDTKRNNQVEEGKPNYNSDYESNSKLSPLLGKPKKSVNFQFENIQ